MKSPDGLTAQKGYVKLNILLHRIFPWGDAQETSLRFPGHPLDEKVPGHALHKKGL